MTGEDELISKMSGEKVKTLAKLVHLQEAHNIRDMTFRSAAHRTRYLLQSRSTYESAVGIIDSMEEEKSKHQDEEERSKVFVALNNFVNYTAGTAYNIVVDLNHRDEYLKKIKDFTAEKVESYNEILGNAQLSSEEKLAQTEKIIQELAEHKRLSLETMMSKQNPSTRNFSKFVRKYRYPQEGVDRWVIKHRRKLIEKKKIRLSDLETDQDGEETEPTEDVTGEETKPTEDVTGEETEPVDVTNGTEDPLLEPTTEISPPKKKSILPDKAEVYDEILASSGMPSHPKLVKFAKRAGRALVAFQLGMIVVDTCESRNPGRTLAKDGLSLGLSMPFGEIGEMVGERVAIAILARIGIATETLAGTGFMFAASFAAGFALGWLAGWLVGKALDYWFEAEDSRRRVAKKVFIPHPSTEHLRPFIAPPVDGGKLARQLTAASATES